MISQQLKLSEEMKIFFFITFFLISSTAFAENSFLKNKTVVGCEDEKGFPPFAYKNKLSGHLEGYSIELLNLVFKDSGAKIEYKLLPWKRCISYMSYGEKMDIVLAATSTEKRREKYIFSDSFTKVHLAYYYDSKRFPNGLSINNPSDFNNLERVCGMRGFVYENYGLSEKVIQTAGSYKQLVKQLVASRCDAILIRYEVFKSLPMIYTDFKHYNRIKGDIIPWGKDSPIEFYFLAKKNSTYHKNLIDFINIRMKQINKSEQIKLLKEKYRIIK